MREPSEFLELNCNWWQFPPEHEVSPKYSTYLSPFILNFNIVVYEFANKSRWCETVHVCFALDTPSDTSQRYK
jgi:hypothetical protein